MTGYESKKKAAQAKLDSMGREALKLALDLATMHHTDDGYAELRSKVRQFAKEALAQPAQEPVAWRRREVGGCWQYFGWEETGMTYQVVERWNKNGFECEAIPASPPQPVQSNG